MKVLKKGFVNLLGTMGDDKAIVEAARISYDPDSTRKTSPNDETLINYLYRHKHTTPFEMVEYKFHLKMPIFVARQWIRHRTASINEVSGRYSVIHDEFYTPSGYRAQSQTNMQGSKDEDIMLHASLAMAWDGTGPQEAFLNYNRVLKRGVSRELARIHLPLSTYTEFIWKIDLHNLLHFLKLRTDPHAQYEIREFARAVETHVAFNCPLAYGAWLKYSKNAYNLSSVERGLMIELLGVLDPDDIKQELNKWDLTKRERLEFMTAFNIPEG